MSSNSLAEKSIDRLKETAQFLVVELMAAGLLDDAFVVNESLMRQIRVINPKVASFAAIETGEDGAGVYRQIPMSELEIEELVSLIKFARRSEYRNANTRSAADVVAAS